MIEYIFIIGIGYYIWKKVHEQDITVMALSTHMRKVHEGPILHGIDRNFGAYIEGGGQDDDHYKRSLTLSGLEDIKKAHCEKHKTNHYLRSKFHTGQQKKNTTWKQPPTDFETKLPNFLSNWYSDATNGRPMTHKRINDLIY